MNKRTVQSICLINLFRNITLHFTLYEFIVFFRKKLCLFFFDFWLTKNMLKITYKSIIMCIASLSKNKLYLKDLNKKEIYIYIKYFMHLLNIRTDYYQTCIFRDLNILQDGYSNDLMYLKTLYQNLDLHHHIRYEDLR